MHQVSIIIFKPLVEFLIIVKTVLMPIFFFLYSQLKYKDSLLRQCFPFICMLGTGPHLPFQSPSISPSLPGLHNEEKYWKGLRNILCQVSTSAHSMLLKIELGYIYFYGMKVFFYVVERHTLTSVCLFHKHKWNRAHTYKHR